MSDSWQFSPEAFVPANLGRSSIVTTSGPGARTCGGQALLFLYRTAPSC
jgi:hypothetical protein